MTDMDSDLRDMIVETYTDMTHVRRQLEQSQSKFLTIVVGVGSAVALAVHGGFWLLGKIWK